MSRLTLFNTHIVDITVSFIYDFSKLLIHIKSIYKEKSVFVSFKMKLV